MVPRKYEGVAKDNGIISKAARMSILPWGESNNPLYRSNCTSLDPRPTNPRNCRAWFANFAIESHMVGVCILVARALPRRRYTELAEVS